MRAKVLFFGMLREMVGKTAEEAEFPEGADLADVFATYAGRYPAVASLKGSLVIARNREFAPLDTLVAEGDEIAFLPPVSGGAASAECPLELVDGPHYFAITRTAIDPKRLIARLQTGAEGAVVTFEGTVRNNTKGRATLCLDYEAYEAMALRVMAQIGREIAAAHAIERVAMVHRLGRLLIGETSVVVIVTAAHRRAAFEAALEGIDRLKKLAPIWKKEHFVDGEAWVAGEWDQNVPVAG